VSESTVSHPGVVGREAELARVANFVARRGSGRGLTLVGEPGIGKTTVWEAGVAGAAENGARVLVARPTEPELQLSFVALADLLEDVGVAEFGDIPPPQLQALEVALLRAEPGAAPPEPHAVAAGFTRVLRRLSESEPVVVAIDDVPWLDRASQDALAFAARRVRGRAIRFLFTRRSGTDSSVESAFGSEGLERVELGALSLGAIRSLLSDRLELSPPRRVLLRLFDLSQGSPLVALELGRMLVERGLPDVGEELPLPDLVDNVFSHRVAALPASTRRALLALSVSGGLTRLQVATLVGPLELEDAVRDGLLVVDGSRVRPFHPLLAAAVRRSSSAEERAGLHLELAETVDNEALRARHLALAATNPDDALAERIDAAAAQAISRGGAHDAIELAEQALRLTPGTSTRHEERLLTLVRYLKIAGEQDRVRELLEARLPDLPSGTARARTLLLLSDSGERLSEMEAYVDRALAECGDDPELRSTGLGMKALIHGIVRYEQLGQAEAWAQKALELARSAGIETQQRALHASAWINVMRGRPVDGLGVGLPMAATSLYESEIGRPAGIRLMVRGSIDESRVVFEHLRGVAAERGEAISASIMHRQLCEIELRAGDVHAAERHLEEWDEWTHPDDPHERVVGPARCRALLEAIRGRPDEAKLWAERAIAAAKSIENFREETEARRAAGLAALLARDPTGAAGELRPLWEHGQREGIRDPGVMPVAPDLVETLVELGELEAARAVTEKLSQLAEEQDHPWALAGTKRCRALVHLGGPGEATGAESDLTQAADEYERLGLHFDSARSLLILGRLRRRRRKWAGARASLEHAAAIYERLGAVGWVDETRAELARVGGRRPVPEGGLTSMERQVAELAAGGHSNKTIAAKLYVTVHTVEKHLSHVYAKLGVRSRGELRNRMPSS
jgi:DNA-binding CsgD family transcriptional regulator